MMKPTQIADRRIWRHNDLSFGGRTIPEETAVALGISPATVKRRWTLARAWLARELEGHLQP